VAEIKLGDLWRKRGTEGQRGQLLGGRVGQRCKAEVAARVLSSLAKEEEEKVSEGQKGNEDGAQTNNREEELKRHSVSARGKGSGRGRSGVECEPTTRHVINCLKRRSKGKARRKRPRETGRLSREWAAAGELKVPELKAAASTRLKTEVPKAKENRRPGVGETVGAGRTRRKRD